MPKISKARIVNFNYNDGNRLIADELFDFSNEKDDDALNVLINLANGGGKSVLVQLMMQPVIPRAKVAGRKIESFFGKLSDHCFVVLEWLKDNGNEKLLTGISMAAREIPSTEDETSGGMGVKYYTFYANYASDASEYSLVNLPLSRNESGRFLPAEYDSMKKLSRKSKGKLCYYASDDNPQWQRKLEEYGLFQEEWRMMEKLNSEEGGLGKFFGDFKTSDQLVDRLFIPTIEGKLKLAHSKEDGSLSTMLLSYAKQYAGQKTRIQEKEEYEAFHRALELLKPLAETLANQFYAQEEETGKLFGLSAALKQEEISFRQKQETAEKRIADLENQLRQIQWEEKSEDYYRLLEALRKTEETWRSTQEQTEQLQAELNQTSEKLKIQECAGYYQQMAEHQNAIFELNRTIAQKEQGMDGSDEIAILGYSAACAIEEAQSALRPQLESSEAKAAALETQVEETRHQVEELQKIVNQAQSAYDQLKGTLDAAETETEQEMENLHADLFRRLDGFYATEELNQLEQEILADQTEQTSAKIQTSETLETVTQRLGDLPQELADCGGEIREQERKKEELEGALSQFRSQEEQIQRICDEHNLDFSFRFTGKIAEYLQREQQTSIAKYGDLLRRLSLAEEEIDAAKSGFLHVPRGVIEYLNSTGVTYSTCEKYLLDLVEAGKLSRESCLELLRNYPAAAYGVLMAEDQNQKFFSFQREQWLPAMIPIFSPQQMETILRNEKTFTGAIAFYAEEYFGDRAHYIAHLTRKQQELLEQKALEEHRKTHLQDQLDAVKAFSYSEDWEPRQMQMIDASENQIRLLNSKRQKLEQERRELQVKQQELNHKIEEYQACIRAIGERLDCLHRVRMRMETEMRLVGQLSDQTRKLNGTQEKYDTESRHLEALQHNRADCQQQAANHRRRMEQLKEAASEVQGRSASERRAGTWEALIQQYRTCMQTQNTELTSLRGQLQSERDQEKKCRKEISKRGLTEDAYLDVVYSEDLESELRRKKQDLEGRRPEQEQRFREAEGARGQAEGLLQSAQKSLAPFGGPLEKAQIGTNFEARSQKCREEKNRQSEASRRYEKEQRTLERERDRLKDYLSAFQSPEHIPEIRLEETYKKQCAEALNTHRQGENSFKQAEKAVSAQLDQMSRNAMGRLTDISRAISGMSELLSNDTRGDRYFTLSIQVDSQMNITDLAIAKISTDLQEFEHSRNDLIRQCTLQGKQIYDGLRQMEASSRVMVYAGKPRQRMIQFKMPEYVDSAVSEAAIADEIDQGTRELAEKLADDSVTDAERKRTAEKIVGSKNLLRKFIGKEWIQVEAYKIDQNPANSGYRKWKETQINNSGAEKFVVYFAVILSLVNYTRGSIGGIQDKELRSVLILDNPFGATSSRHILTPMFAIAKHFRVQMICLSDINKTDVINCFDIVIKAIVKKRPMSNREILTHEGNEQVEHGFYRAEQMSLL